VFNIRIAVAGALSVDICPSFTQKCDGDFGHIITPGRITHIEGNEIHPGGPVANTGIALRIFGTHPVPCARIGRDSMGKMLYEMLNKKLRPFNADTVSIGEEDSTAYSIILAPQGCDRAILQNPGANDHFTADDINWTEVKKCRMFHFGHPSTMAKMYENDGAELVSIMKKADSLGLVTSLDLCAIDPSSDAAKADWKKILSQVLPYVDFFLPSIGDLEGILTDDAENADIGEIANELHRAGAKSLLIKLGEKGMYYNNPGGDFFRIIEKKLRLSAHYMENWENREGYAAAIRPEKIVSGLGAGDVSIAAFLAAILHGLPFDEAMHLALAEGSLCLQDASATGSILPFNKLI